MGLKICKEADYPNEIGDYILTTPDGEFLASWRKQELTVSLVHRMVNEAYNYGYTKGGAQLAQIKQILKG